VASLSQGRTAAAQCGLFTHKSVPVIFEPPCTSYLYTQCQLKFKLHYLGYIFSTMFVFLSTHCWSCTKTCLLFTPNNFLLKFK